MRAETEAAVAAKSFQPTVTPGHALSAKIHSPGSEWFRAVFYDGNDKEHAQEQFNTLLAQVVSCLGPGWRHEVQKWHRYGLPGFSYVNRKYLDLIEENRAFPRFIRIEMIDNSPMPPAKRSGNFFEVSLIINRQRPR